MDADRLALAPLWYIAFLLSTTCHEAAHALVAKLGGDPTAFHGGQVSLNPVPHIRREPFGLVVIPLLSFLIGGWMIGWASAPYDPRWQQRHPRRASWMALAGPAANFTLFLLALVAMRAGLAAGFFAPGRLAMAHIVTAETAGAEGIATLVSIFFSLNLLLGTFNLLPIPPLDGYSVLGIFTTESMALRLSQWAISFRSFSLIGILVGWQLFGSVFPKVFVAALRLVYPSLSLD
jgi:Zn-dependent protease